MSSRYLIVRNNELYHHGIKGQKWGVRRYQNEDGSLTEAGKARYSAAITDSEAKQFRVKRNSAGAYRRALNKTEQAYADTWAEKVYYNKRAQKNMDKMLDRAKKIGYDISNDPAKSGDKKLNKYSDKFLDDLALTKSRVEKMKNIEAETWKIAADAVSKGYDIQMKKINRMTMPDAHRAAHMVLGVFGNMAVGTAMAAMGIPSYMPGSNKFKVKKKQPDSQ